MRALVVAIALCLFCVAAPGAQAGPVRTIVKCVKKGVMLPVYVGKGVVYGVASSVFLWWCFEGEDFR